MNTNEEWMHSMPEFITLQEIKHMYLFEVMKRNRWNRTHTCIEAGISRHTLRDAIKIMRKLGKSIPSSYYEKSPMFTKRIAHSK